MLTIANAGGEAQPVLLMATHRQQDAEVGRRGDDEGNGSPKRFRELETLMPFLGGRHELRGGQADQVLQERARIAEGERVETQAAGQADWFFPRGFLDEVPEDGGEEDAQGRVQA